jgi:hypothetical protein
MADLPEQDIAGYASCSHCPEIHPKILLWRLGGVCPDCIDKSIKPLRYIDVRVDRAGYATMCIRPGKGGSKGSRATKKKAERAKAAALKRLRDLHPDLFAALLAEERALRNLEPWYVTADLEPLDFNQIQASVARLVATHGIRVT